MDRDGKPIFNIYFHGPVGNYQYIEHIDNYHNYKGDYVEAEEIKEFESMPTMERMCTAIEQTINDGYWWASTAWAVVFRVYQIKGYMGSISQFVREVQECSFSKEICYECNDDAISKPLRTGKLSGLPQTWVNNGAQKKHQILAETLLKILDSQE